MASTSGSVTTGAYSDGYSSRSVTFAWSVSSQDVANNKTTISWTLKGSGTGTATAYWQTVGSCSIVIDGTTIWTQSGTVKCYNGTSIGSGTYTLSHNADGTKSFSVTVKAGIYNYGSVNKTGSGSFTLPTIARASSVSCGSLTMGTAGSITITRAASSFTHTLRYAFGTASGTIITKTSDTTVSWTPPTSLASQIPSSTSGTGTIYCDTYSGSTKIGTKSCSVKISVPSSMVPTLGTVSVSLDNSANSTIKGWGIAVAGYTKAKITASASGNTGSSIKSFKITGGYSVTVSGSSLSYTGGIIRSTGTVSFSVTATDSRGRTSAAKSVSITVYAYSNPAISSLSAGRTSTSTTVSVTCNFSFASVNSKNSATATLYYKKQADSSYTSAGTITSGTAKTVTGISETSSYNFKVTVVDAVGNSATMERTVSTAEVLLDFRAGGKGFGIGKIAEADELQVGLPARFTSNVYALSDGTTYDLAIANRYFMAMNVSDCNTADHLIQKWSAGSLNTPYQEGVTSNSEGILISTGTTSSFEYTAQLSITSGKDAEIFARHRNGDTYTPWVRVCGYKTLSPTLNNLTADSRNFCARCGQVVNFAMHAPLKADVASGTAIVSGLPAPLHKQTFIGKGAENVAEYLLSTSGAITCNQDLSSGKWVVVSGSYITSA